MPENWVRACAVADIDKEDLIEVTLMDQKIAVYCDKVGNFFATEATCTHEQVSLCGGLVVGDIIECPKHNGRFNYKTGEALRAPVIHDLKTYPAKRVDDDVFVAI
jgi:3-phenylpropionate/trans-cinnamate dioxygenase ferredoxin subunit